ncbi:SoxR reducing system RseC family protein [Lagierella sp.]|uniref:SoxR reducing system RseC family protein n=1 Tax=Lagierella sp. TaxID=2849657 RepID=UPI00260A5D6A|nr:SoxR reducing system RseC family protein [Lagierella sp.]
MKKSGLVINKDGNKLDILVIRESACGGKCESCAGCSGEDKPLILNVKDDGTLNKGDRVELTMKNSTVLKYSAIVYIIPIIGFILGVVCATMVLEKYNMNNYEFISLLTGLVFLGLSLFILKGIDKKVSKNTNNILTIKKLN